MRRLAVIVTASILLLATSAGAQFADRVSWGPTLPFIKIPLDTLAETSSTLLSAGAGVAPMFNLAPTQDGRWRMVTFALPMFVTYDEGFGWDGGLTIGTLNNLLSFGVAATLIKADDSGGPTTGVFSGDGFTRENTFLIVSASLNFGGGGQGSPEQASKLASHEPVHTRPPGYVGW